MTRGEALEKIAELRAANRGYWFEIDKIVSKSVPQEFAKIMLDPLTLDRRMQLMRVAVEHSPFTTAQWLREININDLKIVQLTADILACRD